MINYFITMLLALLVCYLLGDKHRGICALCVGILMAILAYNMELVDTSDLNRYYYYLDFYREQPIKDVFSFAISKNNLLHHLVMILFSRLPDNHLFTATITFVVYYLVFGLLANASDDNQLSKRAYIVGAAFILLNLNFILVSNVIRIFLVFAVFFYCLYEEGVRRKHKILCWVVYFLLIFYHYAALILIVARIIGSISDISSMDNTRIIYKWILFIVSIIGLVILFNSPLGNYVINKLGDYSDYATRGSLQTIVGWMQFAMILCMLLSDNIFKIGTKKTYALVIIILFFVNLIMYSNYQMILRFGNAMVMCAGVPIASLYKNGTVALNLSKCRIFEAVACMGSLAIFTYTMIYYYHIFL